LKHRCFIHNTYAYVT